MTQWREVIYYYAWKGGPRLSGPPGSPEFIQSYQAAVARRVGNPSVFHAIISGYKASRDFTDLAAKTRKDYLKYIATKETEFADLPLRALDDPRITSDLVGWRDRLPGPAA